MSGSEIARQTGASKSGVNDFLRAFKKCKELQYPLPSGITNYGIAMIVYGSVPGAGGRNENIELPDYEEAAKLMATRKNMTLMFLWNRYKKKCEEEGTRFYQYSQYCELYNNLCILGESDAGKSYLAKALGIQACMKFRTAYYHCEEFLETMVALKQADYLKYQKKIRFHMKLDLLILDDFLLHTLTDEREVKVLFEVMEKRSELSKSTIICSQREPNSWASMILNDEVSANSIMKRATKHYTVVIKPKE